MNHHTVSNLVFLLAVSCVGAAALVLGSCEQAAAGDDANVLRFTVTGMHCDGCAGTIRSEVSKLEGVRSCSVSFEEGAAVVEVDDPSVASAIIEHLAEFEYAATLDGGAPSDQAAGESGPSEAPADAGARQ